MQYAMPWNTELLKHFHGKYHDKTQILLNKNDVYNKPAKVVGERERFTQDFSKLLLKLANKSSIPLIKKISNDHMFNQANRILNRSTTKINILHSSFPNVTNIDTAKNFTRDGLFIHIATAPISAAFPDLNDASQNKNRK